MIKKGYGWIAFWILAIVVTFLSVVSGNFFTKKVSLQIGEIAKETVMAPFQVENEVATNRRRDLAEAGVAKSYKIDSKVQEKAVGDIENLFKYIMAIQTEDLATKLSQTQVEALSDMSPIGLYNEQYEALLSMSQEQLEYMKGVCIKIASTLFESGIKIEDTTRTVEVRSALEETSLSVAIQKVAQDMISYVLSPNVVVDEVATNEGKKLERDKVDPVYVLTGEKIIEAGTKVTEETYMLLDKIGYLDTNKVGKYKQYIGTFILLILMCILCFKYIKGGNPNKKWSSKQLSLVFIAYTVAILLTRAMLGFTFVYIPLSMATMLIAVALGTEFAMIIHVALVIFATTIFKGDIIFILYFMITGVASIMVMRHMLERAKTMTNALLIGGIQLITYLGLKFFIGTTLNVNVVTEAAVAFIMGIVAVVLVVGTLPLLESVFDFITPMQLLELTNPNQPVLKRLLLEATGTYYHSLLVANLAESAADAIGANPLMARVGGYYHDIGKLSCSSYFKENQGKENPHDGLDPYESYENILKHVTYGEELAKEYRLPPYVVDMINEHHGTSCMQFFYIKAKELYGECVKEEDFSYKGPKPRTKEAALVMLADVVEATTRAMQDQLGETVTIEALVTKMVKQKLKEGQLDECELYISDIDKIIESFVKMLKGMYHERIKYPERNDK